MSSTISMTANELFRRAAEFGRCELVRGELRRMNAAGFEHGAIVVRVSTRLHSVVDAGQLGLVLGAETGFILEQNPDTVRAPDVSFVSAERVAASGIPRGFYPGPPDLAVEVVSPSDTAAEVDEKARQWLAAGAKMVWNVRPLTRVVEIYETDRDVRTIASSEMLDGGQIVPGFHCLVNELFPTAPGSR